MVQYLTEAEFKSRFSDQSVVKHYPNPRCKRVGNGYYHIIDGEVITVRELTKSEVLWYLGIDTEERFVQMSDSSGHFPTNLVAGVINGVFHQLAPLSQVTGWVSANMGTRSVALRLEKAENAIQILKDVGFEVKSDL